MPLRYDLFWFGFHSLEWDTIEIGTKSLEIWESGLSQFDIFIPKNASGTTIDLLDVWMTYHETSMDLTATHTIRRVTLG